MVKEIAHLAKSNKSEAYIADALKLFCHAAPFPASLACKYLVSNADQIAKELLEGKTPEQICIAHGMVSSPLSPSSLLYVDLECLISNPSFCLFVSYFSLVFWFA